ncbi:sterol desaturase family protein [Noviherbaspirillum galbum]|uniref:Sterol desaturase family protein n=1 Tax=Noviherbaspirillum galbum TaxID=2709383 RepID=A0A6B3SXR7_9BURK|nr:sterol desaturase family protein [Noviherbaspirillum galbum]NEX63332.1 sterol desaturase family protein [Noviherbaspirillum galbum]
MRYIVAKFFLPTAIAASLVSFLIAREIGGNLEMAVIVPSVAATLCAMGLERIWPARAEWNHAQDDLQTDLSSAAVLFGLIDPVLKWLAPITVVSLYQAVGASAAFNLFPISLPFLLQILVATLIAEFGGYWSHRLHHQDRRLWWLHALHHGSERLHTLNNFRMHPLNYGITYAFGVVPLLMLGTPEAVILGYLALTLPVVMIQHSNLDLRNGWLNYVFSTNEVHRWHHSAQAGEGDNNFGRALVIWDQVFGTYLYRPHGNMPRAVGLYASSHYPARRSYWRQVISMLAPNCCPAKAGI